MKSGLLLTLFLYLIINANAQNSIFQKDSINIQNLILKKRVNKRPDFIFTFY
jgi:hypothetical protein